eukprot:CAMPEP_0174258456 /NCGR_PEP_ID=MMETSP0439-20130205/7442_1 /TAXON_ID=0 /ORGANISM="Stereomyxa ramosa, Strain Chinc5" /LENGTH=949 /DNA_ID=CAMNT_0015341971 /DNA_START=218 /DNA_END=3064 /DNA_ORIENTATION=+
MGDTVGLSCPFVAEIIENYKDKSKKGTLNLTKGGKVMVLACSEDGGVYFGSPLTNDKTKGWFPSSICVQLPNSLSVPDKDSKATRKRSGLLRKKSKEKSKKKEESKEQAQQNNQTTTTTTEDDDDFWGVDDLLLAPQVLQPIPPDFHSDHQNGSPSKATGAQTTPRGDSAGGEKKIDNTDNNNDNCVKNQPHNKSKEQTQTDTNNNKTDITSDIISDAHTDDKQPHLHNNKNKHDDGKGSKDKLKDNDKSKNKDKDKDNEKSKDKMERKNSNNNKDKDGKDNKEKDNKNKNKNSDKEKKREKETEKETEIEKEQEKEKEDKKEKKKDNEKNNDKRKENKQTTFAKLLHKKAPSLPPLETRTAVQLSSSTRVQSDRSFMWISDELGKKKRTRSTSSFTKYSKKKAPPNSARSYSTRETSSTIEALGEENKVQMLRAYGTSASNVKSGVDMNDLLPDPPKRKKSIPELKFKGVNNKGAIQRRLKKERNKRQSLILTTLTSASSYPSNPAQSRNLLKPSEKQEREQKLLAQSTGSLPDVSTRSPSFGWDMKRKDKRKKAKKEASIKPIPKRKKRRGKGQLFGLNLEETMEMQSEVHPHLKLPLVLTSLCRAVVVLDGHQLEGIFRISGNAEFEHQASKLLDADKVIRVDNAHNAAGLLKLWLRSLRDPLVPYDLLPKILDTVDNVDDSLNALDDMPPINRKVLMFLIQYLKECILPHSVHTKMDQGNLAMVITPCVIRCPSEMSAIQLVTTVEKGKQFINNLFEYNFEGEVDFETDKKEIDFVVEKSNQNDVKKTEVPGQWMGIASEYTIEEMNKQKEKEEREREKERNREKEKGKNKNIFKKKRDTDSPPPSDPFPGIPLHTPDSDFVSETISRGSSISREFAKDDTSESPTEKPQATTDDAGNMPLTAELSIEQPPEPILLTSTSIVKTTGEGLSMSDSNEGSESSDEDL